MDRKELKINAQSIKNELKSYADNPYGCLFEYFWNSFDAGATEVRLDFVAPKEGFGNVQNVTISDNGRGWDFTDEAITDHFISSTKDSVKNKTLPRGQYGRGRYAFIWIANKLHVYSKSKRMTLHHNTEIHTEDIDETINGTRVEFVQINEKLSDALMSNELYHALELEFCWFLSENDKYRIFINNNLLECNSLVKASYQYEKNQLPNSIRDIIDDSFSAKVVIWKEKPSEYSKFYFLDSNNQEELYKSNTGLNKKSDDFWHSVYLTSSLFTNTDGDLTEDENNAQQRIEFPNDNRRLIKQVISFFKKELIEIRKPYLKKQSSVMYNSLVEDKALPDLHEFGIYDDKSFEELIKTIYIISPSLFTNKSSSEKRFICATFAGLLSTQDNNLIKIVLEQLQELTKEEQNDLIDILNKTKLSNVISTIKEIDHRLEVIEKLKILISEHEKETLEVKHIQKILDNNFWIFGEQFRLFSSTEGALKNVLLNYARNILLIDDPELDNNPTGEVDLFLTKNEQIGDYCQKNIIVELKRASKKLGKKEYDQLEEYMEKIADESLCNGENQYWEFYLVGKDYDEHIAKKIDSAKNYGEQRRGLCYCINNSRFKLYVRKWSDILEVEWGTKMKYLKDKLQIHRKVIYQTPNEITQELTTY